MFRFRKWRLAKAAALCASLMMLSPAALMAQETAGELGDISLGDLLNLKVSVATKSEMTLEEAPSIVSVITAKEIRNMGARSIVDVLRTVPGFDVTHVINQPSHCLRIRGMSSPNNQKSKIMINGHWLNIFDGSSQYYMDRIPLASIRQVEIIRGPGSALYGASAFLGVINIVTEEGGDQPSEISLEGGSYGTFQPYGKFSYKNGDFKAYMYADAYTTDGYDGIIESDMATNSPIFASSVPGEMTADGEHYNFQTTLNYKHFYFSGAVHKFDTNNPVGVARILADEDNVDHFYMFGELGCKVPLEDKGSLLIKTYYDFHKFKHVWEIFPEETAELPLHTDFPEGEGVYGSPRAKTSTFGGELTADYEIFSGIQMVGGVLCDYYRQFDTESWANYNLTGHDLEIDGIVYPPFPFKYLQGGFQDISEDGNWSVEEENRLTTAVYAQGTFDLKHLFRLKKSVKSFALTAGLRYDNYDDIGSTTNPRFGLVYAPGEKLHFKALYGEAFRSPSFSQMYYRNNPNVDGNPNLKPETIRTMEGLVGYNLSKNVRIGITLFHYKVDDLIGVRDKFYQNLGKMEGSGVEGEMKLFFDKYKYAWFNFTWQNAKDTTNKAIVSEGGQVYAQEDFGIGSIPKYMFNAGVNYDLSRYVNANISLNYVGERERSEEMKWDGENLVRIDERDPVKDRTLVNASLTFRNFCKGLEIQISVFNLFDADHRDPDSAGKLYYDMPSPGRWFMGRVSYSF